MSIFINDKNERPTALGYFIEGVMQGVCESAVACEIGEGASYRQAMARVGRKNPFMAGQLSTSLEAIKGNHSDWGDLKDLNQDDLDSLWMGITMDICLSNIL